MIRFIIGNHKIFFIVWGKNRGIIDCFIKVNNKKVFEKKGITLGDAGEILRESMRLIVSDEYDACA